VWVIPSCGDDAVNRTMVRVVATVVRVSRDACRTSRLLYCFHALYSYCEGLGCNGSFEVHNSARVVRINYIYERPLYATIYTTSNCYFLSL
jgi:hypothetical protein